MFGFNGAVGGEGVPKCPQEHRACTELLCRSCEWRGGEM